MKAMSMPRSAYCTRRFSSNASDSVYGPYSCRQEDQEEEAAAKVCRGRGRNRARPVPELRCARRHARSLEMAKRRRRSS